MQRINLWPNPKFDPTGFHVVKKGGDISKYMTGGTLANTRGEYIDLPFACEVGVEYVCTFRIVSNDTTNKSIGIFFGSTTFLVCCDAQMLSIRFRLRPSFSPRSS